jgi:acyl-homoserine-lactone acylase
MRKVARICGAAVAVVFASLVASGCGRHEDVRVAVPNARVHAELSRTTHGVVHVRASDFRGLGYGLAYAYAQDNVCMFADTLLTVRGERSRYFGPAAQATEPVNGEYGAAIEYLQVNNEASDFFFKAYLDPEQLKAGYAAGSAEARALLAGYAEGYNRYLRDYAGRYPRACNKATWVKPITVEDMYLVLAEKALHASGEVFAQEFFNGGRSAGQTAPRQPAQSIKVDQGLLRMRLDRFVGEQLGSNAIGVGKELTDNGRGLLLGNPHYPWTSTDRFYQAHLTVPGRYDAMGVILGGIPMIVIGFNNDIAWTHTVTTAVHFTTFKLKLDPRDASGTTYLSDGVPLKMRSRAVEIDVLQADGRLAKRSKTFYFSKQGAVLLWPEAGMPWTQNEVTVLADPNRNNTRLIEQWIAIGSARSVGELKGALERVVGLPWVNTVAADRDGNALFADASVVPHVTSNRFASDCFLVPQLLTFDGSRTACGWGLDQFAPLGTFSPANGPSMLRADYVANSNDSYWLTNARQLLKGPAPFGYSPLYGRTDVEQSLRTRIGFRQLEEKIGERRKLALNDLQDLAFANRLYAADMVLPELLPRCEASGDAALQPACAALAAWDRRVNLDSRGAVLFREFWQLASAIPGKWLVPFDAADPIHTPRSLAPAATPALLAALKTAMQKLQALHIPLDGRLGDYQSESRNGVRFPLHGAMGNVDGSYNSIRMRGTLAQGGYHDVAWGTSYVQTVGFDSKGPLASGMLVYGQSVDPASPYYADQLPHYVSKQFPALPFTPEKIRADPAYQRQILSD